MDRMMKENKIGKTLIGWGASKIGDEIRSTHVVDVAPASDPGVATMTGQVEESDTSEIKHESPGT